MSDKIKIADPAFWLEIKEANLKITRLEKQLAIAKYFIHWTTDFMPNNFSIREQGDKVLAEIKKIGEEK